MIYVLTIYPEDLNFYIENFKVIVIIFLAYTLMTGKQIILLIKYFKVYSWFLQFRKVDIRLM